MNLSIRHWLTDNHIEISQIKGFSQEQLTGIALRIIRNIEVKSPLPFDICTLAEVLELPLGNVWHEIGVIARLTQSIFGLLAQNKPFERNEATWLAFQVAYLKALSSILVEEESLSRVWLERVLVNVGEAQLNLSFADEHLPALSKLRQEKLTDSQAEEALLMVADSTFVQQISRVTVAWLVANSIQEAEAQLIIRRLENKLWGHLIEVVSENAAALVQLQRFFNLGSQIKLKTTEIRSVSSDRIDLNRETYRASLIKRIGEPLLIESFSLKDIYVPLAGLPFKDNRQPVDLINWVVAQLEDLETITVIESESGYGKTSFCEIFAAQVAQKHYPEWTPVNISLSDVVIGDNFQETLASAFVQDFQINLSSWLEQNNHKCLLILDGLNEIPNSTENKSITTIFIQQLLEFQSRFKHKIILTSQSWALQNIISETAFKLQRIKIQPWGQQEWKQWFEKWAKLQSIVVSQNFFKFLKINRAFSQRSHFLLSDLVRQPLMLYLLAVLHRDELLDSEILQLATNPRITNSAVVLWAIYERLNQWLFGYPYGISQLTLSVPTHIHRTPEAVNLFTKNRHPQELIDTMQAVALQILHSGKKKIHLQNNQNNLNKLPAFYFKSTVTYKQQDALTTKINSPPSPLVSPSPHHPITSPPSTIKFSHPKFAEYLCAASIVTQLKTLTKCDRNSYGEMIFAVDSLNSIAEKLYYLLGFGIISPEIEQLVIEGLRREQKNQQKHKFSFELLCDRLLPFWYAYCGGRWLDEGIAHKARLYFQQLQNPVNVEQVNAAVGINVFLLLSACYRQTKHTFSPCGTVLKEWNSEAVRKLIAKTALFHPDITRERIGEKSLTSLDLSKADLTQAMLAGINFASTDLSDVQLKDACLAGANLADVNLTGADLTGANLINANLTNANLTGANLTGANLLGVNLDLVNLSNACLFQAIIAEAQKETAIADGAVFSLDKFEELKRLLSYQSQTYDPDIGETTEIVFKETPSIGEIESAEGEPILPLDLDDTEDETVLGTTDFE